MSYEMCKNILLKPNKNQIFITTASNNETPKTYYRKEYGKKLNINLDEKLLYLMISMLDGNIQISQLNKNTIPFKYALTRVRNYYREKDINLYGNKYDRRHELYEKKLSKYVDTKDWKQRYEFEQKNKELITNIELEINKNLYNKEFEIFKNAITEEINGKYYLKDDLGRIIEYKGETKYGYRYRTYEFPNEDCLLDYKLAYIRKDYMGKEFQIEKYEKIKTIEKEELDEYEETI